MNHSELFVLGPPARAYREIDVPVPDVAARRRFFTSLLLLSAFGPYLVMSAGVRTDHLAVYGLGLWALGVVASGRRVLALPSTVWVIVGSLAAATAWTLLVSLFAARASALEFVAGAENYAQPIVLAFGVAVLVATGSCDERRAILRWSALLACALLAANTLLAIASIFVDTWPVVRYFVRGATSTGLSVWENAAALGRFSGVFGQPLEAGVAYSAGLVGWVYAAGSSRGPGARGLVLLALLVIGGFLSVSKVFILGGVPLACLYLAWTHRSSVRTLLRFFFATVIFLAIFVPSSVWLLQRWSGGGYLLRLFDAEVIGREGALELFTSGRLGSESMVASLFAEAWTQAPFSGFGFGAYSPLDNGYLQFFYQGGLVGLSLYLVVLASLACHAIQTRQTARDESRLLAVLLVLIVGAGIGAPVLTLNRASIVLWVLVFLAASVASARGPLPRTGP